MEGSLSAVSLVATLPFVICITFCPGLGRFTLSLNLPALCCAVCISTGLAVRATTQLAQQSPSILTDELGFWQASLLCKRPGADLLGPLATLERLSISQDPLSNAPSFTGAWPADWATGFPNLKVLSSDYTHIGPAIPLGNVSPRKSHMESQPALHHRGCEVLGQYS